MTRACARCRVAVLVSAGRLYSVPGETPPSDRMTTMAALAAEEDGR